MESLKDITILNDLLKEEARIEDVLIDHYGLDLVEAGRQLRCLSPFNPNDSDPSFYVDTEKQLYNCFSTGQGGDVIELIKALENLEYIDALAFLAGLIEFDLGPYRLASNEEDEARQGIINQNVAAQLYFNSHFDDTAFTTWWNKRGFEEETMRTFGIGYCPRINRTSPQAIGGKSVTIPLRGDGGTIMGFRHRPFIGKVKVVGPKSNHPLDLPPVYGFDVARRFIRKSGGTVIVVEGEPDCWRLHEIGIQNVLAIQGTKLPKESIDYLVNRGVRHIVVMPDGDKAGLHFAKRVASSEYMPCKISIAILPEGDPDELGLDNPSIIKKSIKRAKHVIEFLVDSLIEEDNPQTMTQKLEFLDKLKSVLAAKDSATFDLGVRYIAERIDMDSSAITDFFREEDTEHAPLQNANAERHIIGALIGDEGFRVESMPSISDEDFYLDRHSTIFLCVARLAKEGRSINRDVVDTELTNAGQTGLVRYMHHLMGKYDVGVARSLLPDILDKASRRKTQDMARQTIKELGNMTSDGGAIIETLVSKLAGVVSKGVEIYSVNEIVAERMQRFHEMVADPRNITGIDLGANFQTLNQTLHGLHTSRYLVSAAPSGAGKTTTAIEVANRCAIEIGVPCTFFTFETTRHVLIDRLISNRSGVPIQAISTGQVSREQAKSIQKAAVEVKNAPLNVIEDGRSIEQFVSLLTSEVMRHGTKVAFVDYIQLMKSIEASRDRVPRYQEIEAISQMMLRISQRLDVALWVVAQLNREGVKKGVTGKGVDVGGAFAIYQDSDIFVTTIEKSPDDMGRWGIELGNRLSTIDKNRIDGPSAVKFHANLESNVSRFYECHKVEDD